MTQRDVMYSKTHRFFFLCEIRPMGRNLRKVNLSSENIVLVSTPRFFVCFALHNAN